MKVQINWDFSGVEAAGNRQMTSSSASWLSGETDSTRLESGGVGHDRSGTAGSSRSGPGPVDAVYSYDARQIRQFAWWAWDADKVGMGWPRRKSDGAGRLDVPYVAIPGPRSQW